MKKILVITAFVLFSAGLTAQVFQTAYTLKQRTFSFGINPAFRSNDFGLYLHGGYGLKAGMDLGLKAGIGFGDPYFGADIKWLLTGGTPSIGVSAGVHVHHDPGFDGTLNITFPINSSTHLYSGIDVDIIFSNDIYVPAWVPIGLEVGVKSNMTIILEGAIGINRYGPHIVNGGVTFYF